jgi:hypothetical protein
LRLLLFHRHFEVGFAVVSLLVLGLALVGWRLALGLVTGVLAGREEGGS